MAKHSKKEVQEAFDTLRKMLKPGDTVHTILDNVSRSGMSRNIRVVVLRDGEAMHPNYSVSVLLGYPWAKHGDGMRVGGCGMDMGFALVYHLSCVLFPNGFECIGQGCPSNDHSNGDRDYTPHHHQEGGYALRHRWL